jgi:hypothetical protein
MCGDIELSSPTKGFWTLLVFFIFFYFSVLFNLRELLHMPLLNVFLGVPPDELRDYWTHSADIIWDIPIEEKIIAVTFDDGPDPVFTPKVLEILEKITQREPSLFLENRLRNIPRWKK